MPHRFGDNKPRDAEDGPSLSHQLRTVLASQRKTAILCLLDAHGPAAATDLVDKLSGPTDLDRVSHHLEELTALGYLKPVDRGADPKAFDLIDRANSWRAFLAEINKTAPHCVAASSGAASPLDV